MRIYFTLFCLFLSQSILAEINPNSVVIVVNETSEASLSIGNYYAQARNIPKENIVRIKTSQDQDITWENYINTIHNPLKWELHKRSWLTGIRLNKLDDLGREQYNVSGHKISYLILCKDIPIKILHDDALLKKEAHRLPKKIEFLKTGSSVEGELSLLTMEDTPVVGLVKNPHFKLYEKQDKEKELIIKIARLDGPDEASIKKMIDGALLAEREGLMGRSYVDASGPHVMGNKWMRLIAQKLKSLGFDGVYRENNPFTREDRFEAPAIYFGWWQEHVKGPFEEKDMQFTPGAIAVHLHSRSAEITRDASKRWVGPLISKGAAATLGNVDEPYLQCSHYLQILFESLANGDNWADAGYKALPFLSWQAILIGDPLYTPFKKNLKDQIKRIQAGGGTPYKQYAIIRQMHLLEQADRMEDAILLGKHFFEKEPGLALQFEVSKLLSKTGNKAEAIKRLNFMHFYSNFQIEVQGLACDIADFLLEQGATNDGLSIYETLIEEAHLDPEKREIYAQRGMRAARQVGLSPLATHWKKLISMKK